MGMVPRSCLCTKPCSLRMEVGGSSTEGMQPVKECLHEPTRVMVRFTAQCQAALSQDCEVMLHG